MKIKDSYSKKAYMFLNIKHSVKVFPYFGYLLTFFPFVAILMSQGLFGTLDFLLLIPFIPAMAAGFMYNTLCDSDKDPPNKNAITSGLLTKKAAFYFTAFSAVVSIVLFIALYSSVLAIVFGIVYVFLWLSYSGLKIRFKESYAAPIVASFVLWIGGPIIFLFEFNYFGSAVLLMLIGFFLTSTGFETNHTIGDYEVDKKYNCKTFAVRVGKKIAIIVKHLLLVSGFLVLLWSGYSWLQASILMPVFIVFFLIAEVMMAMLDILDTNTSWRFFKEFFFASPFFIVRLFILFAGLIVLAIPIPYFILFIWVFLTDKSSFTI